VLRLLVTSNKNKRERACLRGPSPSTSRLPGQAGTSGTQAYSNVLNARSNPDGANSANADVFRENQSSGFLNRVRWFDSGRGHSREAVSEAASRLFQDSRVGPHERKMRFSSA